MKSAMVILACLIMCVASGITAAPQQINYQGYLTDTGGSPLDTTVAMTFKLYTDSTAGTLLWTEIRPSITVTDGLFNVRIGQVTALGDDVFNNAQVWLGITVGNNSEMTPRSRIVSIGYAYRVGTVDGASGGTVISDLVVQGRGNFGSGNVNTGAYAFVAGLGGTATGNYSAIGGGRGNTASDLYSTVSGGTDNAASDSCTTVSGGSNNAATYDYATVAGGYGNYASARYATVAGGKSNSAGYSATVAGGEGNEASSGWGTVGGGYHNRATILDATVSGGRNNLAGQTATVGGGEYNEATGYYATVGGGTSNDASASSSTVCGGWNNSVTGFNSTVAGGANNACSGNGTLVCGNNAHAVSDSSFVFNDGRYDGNIGQTTQPRRFIAIASNGTYFYSNATATTGSYLAAGSGTWNSISDSTKKHRFGKVDTKDVLDKVAALTIERWSYKTQEESIQHIGPMAQDFWKLFHVGDDSLAISTIDPSGIALAAIQELQKRNALLEKRVELLEKQLQLSENISNLVNKASIIPKTN